MEIGKIGFNLKGTEAGTVIIKITVSSARERSLVSARLKKARLKTETSMMRDLSREIKDPRFQISPVPLTYLISLLN